MHPVAIREESSSRPISPLLIIMNWSDNHPSIEDRRKPIDFTRPLHRLFCSQASIGEMNSKHVIRSQDQSTKLIMPKLRRSISWAHQATTDQHMWFRRSAVVSLDKATVLVCLSFSLSPQLLMDKAREKASFIHNHRTEVKKHWNNHFLLFLLSNTQQTQESISV